MPSHSIKKVSFAGLGLIGTSMMQALKYAAALTGRSIETIGYDPGFVPDDITYITESGGLDRFEPDPALLYDADVIVLCAPVLTNIALLDEVHRHAPAGALVTDVSSTKTEIAARAEQLGMEFIGMHPIAGREQQGCRAASSELLCGRLMIFCSGERLPETGHAGDLVDLLRASGCIPVVMTPEAHDRVYANISHLPQLISTALMTHCSENIDRSGPGFASVSRLAGSPWPVWRDILATNSGNIADELDAFSGTLSGLADEVRARNFEVLESMFLEANRLYQFLQGAPRP
ncbi:MAG: prephenate dehydrogenase/arogenate dehydrogenase family protein [Chlorobiaceae bacterium]|nr:prephenate dehydrogenase/arogenate dehydrogenase family protein [Chlorobiaceae bacterium]